jgi:flagellar biosynthesis/type III secretory pathway protein FliH
LINAALAVNMANRAALTDIRASIKAGFANGFAKGFASGFAKGFAAGLAIGLTAGLATGFAMTASGAVLRPHLPWMQLMASVTDCLLGWPRDFLKCTMQAPLASNEALDLGTI